MERIYWAGKPEHRRASDAEFLASVWVHCDSFMYQRRSTASTEVSEDMVGRASHINSLPSKNPKSATPNKCFARRVAHMSPKHLFLCVVSSAFVGSLHFSPNSLHKSIYFVSVCLMFEVSKVVCCIVFESQNWPKWGPEQFWNHSGVPLAPVDAPGRQFPHESVTFWEASGVSLVTLFCCFFFLFF